MASWTWRNLGRSGDRKDSVWRTHGPGGFSRDVPWTEPKAKSMRRNCLQSGWWGVRWWWVQWKLHPHDPPHSSQSPTQPILSGDSGQRSSREGWPRVDDPWRSRMSKKLEQRNCQRGWSCSFVHSFIHSTNISKVGSTGPRPTGHWKTGENA